MERRPYAHGLRPPTQEAEREWQYRRLVTNSGEPTTEEAAAVLRVFFESPQATISAAVVSRRTFLDPHQALSVCRQLAVLHALTERPIQSCSFCVSDDPRSQPLIQAIARHLNVPASHVANKAA